MVGVKLLVGVIVGVGVGDLPGVGVTVGVLVGVAVGTQKQSGAYAQYGPASEFMLVMHSGSLSFWVAYFQYPAF